MGNVTAHAHFAHTNYVLSIPFLPCDITYTISEAQALCYPKPRGSKVVRNNRLGRGPGNEANTLLGAIILDGGALINHPKFGCPGALLTTWVSQKHPNFKESEIMLKQFRRCYISTSLVLP